jgi:hypothetical protein
MGSVVVVIVDVTADNPPQPGLCENDEVVQTFPPDGADKPFGVSVHVVGRIGRCGNACKVIPEERKKRYTPGKSYAIL